MYVRKTYDIWVIMSNYGYGWEEETEYETRTEGKQGLKEYRENGGGSYFLKKKRVKIGG